MVTAGSGRGLERVNSKVENSGWSPHDQKRRPPQEHH